MNSLPIANRRYSTLKELTPARPPPGVMDEKAGRVFGSQYIPAAMAQVLLLRSGWWIAVLTICLTVAGENWPEFRGPTGQGHSQARNVPLEWNHGKNILWKQALPGNGWSSPVVHHQRVYLTTAVTNSADTTVSLRVLCLDANTGKPVWNVEAFNAGARPLGIHTKNSNASPTPIVEEDRIYAHFGHHGAASLDLNGKVLWRQKEISYQPVHGNGGSPAIAGESLIFNCDGASDPFVVALNKRDGSLRWRAARKTDASKTFSFSTPLVISVNGRKQVISPGSNVVCAFDPDDGREIWHVRYEGYSVIPRPVYGHGMVFIGTGYDRPSVMAIRVDGKGDVTDTHVVWTMKRSAPNTPSLLLIGSELFMISDGGIASCVDALSGKIHWQERIGGNYSASPVYAERRVYFQNEEGTGTVIAASKEFKKLAVNSLDERTLASYAVADGALFIRSANHLFRVGSGSVTRSTRGP